VNIFTFWKESTESHEKDRLELINKTNREYKNPKKTPEISLNQHSGKKMEEFFRIFKSKVDCS
jgi:RNase P/RNase MRP subunit p30